MKESETMGSSSIHYFSFKKFLVLFLFGFVFVSAFSQTAATHQSQKKQSLNSRSRRLLEFDSELEEHVKPKKKTNLSTITKNQTKLIKPTTNSTKTSTTKTLTTTSLPNKKLNSTSNSFKSNSNSTKKSIDLSKDSKPTSPKNKTKTPITKQSPPSSQSLLTEKKPQIKPKQTQKPTTPNWMDFDLDGEFVSEFKDLPFKFQKNLIPDLERISTTSKAYIFQANKEITKGFKPLVGNKYASTIASITSCIFIIAPLLLVSLIFNRIKAYFSLQKLLIFIQIYLAIYFLILCLASVVSGLEPLKFFYATSQSSYVCLQVLQTLGYVLYLLMLLMYLVLVFASEVGVGSRMLGLIQTIVGFAVGLHYYVSVFHRAVLHQAPKTNWKVHGIYATCFFVICALAGAERRKKAYLEDGGDEGKKS